MKAIIVAGIVFVTTSLTVQQPASMKDIARITACMEKQNCKNIILAKGYGGELGWQVVFIDSGKRYTFYWPGRHERIRSWLAVWARPNGTQGREQLVYCSDDGPDGLVDDGSQELYNEAIAVAVRQLL